MTKVRGIAMYLVILFSCSQGGSENRATILSIKSIQDIPAPLGYEKVEKDSLSFEKYLTELPIKQDDTVWLYNGKAKYNQSLHYAILQFDVGHKDLQQCADAVIRMKAEYLFGQSRNKEITFHFTSGHEMKWTDYAQGIRPKIAGNNVTFLKTAKPNSSYESFRNYLELIFTYCGTASLQYDVEKAEKLIIQAGDIYLQSRNPYGHAVMVMDVARDSSGNTIFLLAQSYMPAQTIHILKNLQNTQLSPWFEFDDSKDLVTPEWTFPANSRVSWK
jgi:Domain of unknown function (4846)